MSSTRTSNVLPFKIPFSAIDAVKGDERAIQEVINMIWPKKPAEIIELWRKK